MTVKEWKSAKAYLIWKLLHTDKTNNLAAKNWRRMLERIELKNLSWWFRFKVWIIKLIG